MDMLHTFYWNYKVFNIMKTYPIGTAIRFLDSGPDKGKTGKIVKISGNMPVIFLPKGQKNVRLIDGLMVTWLCSWDVIEPLRIKGEQLLFDFMYK